MEAAAQATTLLESLTQLGGLLGRLGAGVDELRRETVWAASVVAQQRAEERHLLSTGVNEIIQL